MSGQSLIIGRFLLLCNRTHLSCLLCRTLTACNFFGGRLPRAARTFSALALGWYVLRFQRFCRFAARDAGRLVLFAGSCHAAGYKPAARPENRRFLVKVDKTDSRGQHVPSAIASIVSIAACGDNNVQRVTDYARKQRSLSFALADWLRPCIFVKSGKSAGPQPGLASF